MGSHLSDVLVVVLATAFLLGCVETKNAPKEPTALQKEIAAGLAKARTSGAFASTAMTLLNAMANKKMKGVDAPLAKRILYRMTYKVVALREDAPELTKADLKIYTETLTEPALKQLFDLMKNADPEQQKFDIVKYDRISRGHTFVVCGDGDIYAFTIRPSESGLFGADIYIVTPKSALALHGFTIAIQGKPPAVKEFTCDLRGNNLRIAHKASLDGEFEVIATVAPDGSTMRIAVESPREISDMYIASMEGKAKAVCVAPGKVIQDPKSFVLPSGAEKLATRSLGIDFDSGLSLVQGGENPADRIVVDPDKGVYALHTHGGAFWLVPSSRGAAEAEKRFQAAAKKK